jgi:hypothetical protein
MGLSRALIDVTPLRESATFRRLWVGQMACSAGRWLTIPAVARYRAPGVVGV